MKEKIKETNDRNGYREVEKKTQKKPPPKKNNLFQKIWERIRERFFMLMLMIL